MIVRMARTCDINPINPKEEVAEINSTVAVKLTLIVTIRWLCSPGWLCERDGNIRQILFPFTSDCKIYLSEGLWNSIGQSPILPKTMKKNFI